MVRGDDGTSGATRERNRYEDWIGHAAILGSGTGVHCRAAARLTQ
jgi:hypothetical protein